MQRGRRKPGIEQRVTLQLVQFLDCNKNRTLTNHKKEEGAIQEEEREGCVCVKVERQKNSEITMSIIAVCVSPCSCIGPISTCSFFIASWLCFIFIQIKVVSLQAYNYQFYCCHLSNQLVQFPCFHLLFGLIIVANLFHCTVSFAPWASSSLSLTVSFVELVQYFQFLCSQLDQSNKLVQFPDSSLSLGPEQTNTWYPVS